GERFAVGSPMTGDRDVSLFARQRRLRVVAGARPEGARRGALDDHDVDPDGRDADAGEAVAGADSALAVRLLERGAGELPVETGLQPVLVDVRGERIADEPEAEQQEGHGDPRQDAPGPRARA